MTSTAVDRGLLRYDRILDAVAEYTGVGRDHIASPEMVPEVIHARRLAMALLDRMPGWGRVRIARRFNRSVPAVVDAVGVVEYLAATDDRLAGWLRLQTEQIGEGDNLG
jgi:chromosomal replication initiation ATPase DnaA